MVGVVGWVVLRGCSCCRGGAALAHSRLLGGRGGGGLDVAALHLDAAQALPVAPLQKQVALRRRAAARGAPRVVVVPRLLLHFPDELKFQGRGRDEIAVNLE